MQFDDEKDINNNQDGLQSGEAISWEDLLSSDDGDFSNLINTDAFQEEHKQPVENKQSGILDFDVSSLENVLPEEEKEEQPVNEETSDTPLEEVNNAPSEEENPSDITISPIPVEDMADISLDITSDAQKLSDAVDNELLNVLGFDSPSETSDDASYTAETDSFVNEQNTGNIEPNTVEPEFNSFDRNTGSSDENDSNEEYVPYVGAKQPSNGKKGLIAAVLVGVIAAGSFAAFKFLPDLLSISKGESQELISAADNTYTQNENADIEKLKKETDALLNEANALLNETEGKGADQTIAKIKAQNKKDKEKAKEPVEKKVVVQVQNTGRSNPFLPSTLFDATGFTSFDGGLSLPPDPLVEAPNAEEARQLLSMTVSGIMYDPQRPSAIIKFNDTDYFVQKGDKIDNYLVTSITKEFVSIKNNANTYKAYVGEAFVEENTGARLQADMIKTRTGGRQYISSGDITITTK